MSFAALKVRAWSRAARGGVEPRLVRRARVTAVLAALALAASGCQSALTGPVYSSNAYLLFTVEPPVFATVGHPLSSPVQVSVVDGTGRTLTGYSASVTITLGPNQGPARLSGTTTVPTSAGVATFSDLSVDRLGTYTLVATVSGLPTAASQPFEVDLPSTLTGARVADVGASAVAVSHAAD